MEIRKKKEVTKGKRRAELALQLGTLDPAVEEGRVTAGPKIVCFPTQNVQ